MTFTVPQKNHRRTDSRQRESIRKCGKRIPELPDWDWAQKSVFQEPQHPFFKKSKLLGILIAKTDLMETTNRRSFVLGFILNP